MPPLLGLGSVVNCALLEDLSLNKTSSKMFANIKDTVYIEHRYCLSSHCLLSLSVLLNAEDCKMHYFCEH